MLFRLCKKKVKYALKKEYTDKKGIVHKVGEMVERLNLFLDINGTLVQVDPSFQDKFNLLCTLADDLDKEEQ